MKSKKLASGTVLIFETGDEVVSTLTKFAKDNHLGAGHFTAIGAFRDVGLGYFDLERKDYLKNSVNEQVEVVSLMATLRSIKANPRSTPTLSLEKRTVRRWEGIFLRRMCGQRWSLFFKARENS